GYGNCWADGENSEKLGGKRVGPAEVESIRVGQESVIEAATVGVPDELKGNTMVAFCVLAPGEAGSAKLAEELRERVAAGLGKPLRPPKNFFLQAAPKKRKAKEMRRVIRAAFLGEEPGDTNPLEKPAGGEAARHGGEK